MIHLSAIAMALASIIPGAVTAPDTSAKPVVPTTKLLAIGSVTAPITPEERETIMPKEVRSTVNLYLQGKIDQWWFRTDGKGVVFLLNVTSVDEAHDMLEQLPLGVAKRMTFEFIPLGPLYPLRLLTGDQN